MRNWMKKQRVGLSVKSMEELERAIRLGANMVEIKLEKFAQNGTPLYIMKENGEFIEITHRILKVKEVTFMKGTEVQFHLPLERCVDVTKETGINVALKEHHEIALKRFRFFEQLYREYGIGETITVHPPTISFGGRQVVSEETAIENAREFFMRLDDMRREENHRTRIGVENQTDPKIEAGLIGNKTEHFKRMLRDTRTIGLTIDTGHRRLSRNHAVRELMQLGLEIVNFHFHGNDGIFREDNYDDDQHLLPDYDNVTGFPNFIRHFKRHRVPMILEIAKLARYKDEDLESFINRLKRETE